MKNYEKYAEKIKTYTNGNSYCEEIITPNVLKPLGKSCSGTGCTVCKSLTTIWLLEEYEEPETDWSKVEVDTPILVKNHVGDKWLKGHFAEYEGGKIYAWTGGKTSWTEDCATGWNYAKLAEGEEE